MSVHPKNPDDRAPEHAAAAAAPDRRPVTLPELAEMKLRAEPIVMVTAYDHPSAQVVEAAGVDVVLVGDSAAMTVLGYDSTVPVGIDEMVMLASAVRRGLRTPLLVGDLPFGSYERSNEQAIETAMRFVKEAGCDAVKLERGGSSVDRARAIVRAGIPVMGHVGLTPQTATALGGFKARGKTAGQASTIAEEALALQAAGCFAIVFEAIPAAITDALMPKMTIPVIGIGAGLGHRRPGARLPRPARDLRRPRGEVREALRRGPRGDDPRRQRLRGRGPRRLVPRGRARVRRRRGRGRGVQGLSGAGIARVGERVRRRLVGDRDLGAARAKPKAASHSLNFRR